MAAAGRERGVMSILGRVRSDITKASGRLGFVGRALLGRLRGARETGLYYVVEKAAWSIRHDGESIARSLHTIQPDLNCRVVESARHLYHQVVHFGSLWTLCSNIRVVHESNHLVATVFHGREDMSERFRGAFSRLREFLPRLRIIVTPCSLMVERLTDWGVPAQKLRRIPLGVDLDIFRPVGAAERQEIRNRLGIPEDAVCIGSFQKDGVGWEEGLQPKLIKGPDVFLEAVRRLSGMYPVYVLLTGPARGYVKRGLEAAGIRFRHDYLHLIEDLPSYYNALDLYLVTSREEGGPKALLESMATGVPLVTTRVGMAPDIVQHGRNGMLVDVEDATGVAGAASLLIEDGELRRRVVGAGLETAQAYDWKTIAKQYYDQVYEELLCG